MSWFIRGAKAVAKIAFSLVMAMVIFAFISWSLGFITEWAKRRDAEEEKSRLETERICEALRKKLISDLTVGEAEQLKSSCGISVSVR